MFKLDILLEDVLTANSCSVLVIEIIKYVAYNSKLIPFNYNTLKQNVYFCSDKFRDLQDSVENRDRLTIHQRKAGSFLKQITNVFENFEVTFKKLEIEFYSLYGVKEVVIIIGPTLVVPKYILRIVIPSLIFGHSPIHVRKNLLTVFRKMQECQEVSDSLFRINGPTNMFILIGVAPGSNGPESSWFIPTEKVTFSEKIPQTTINLFNPGDNNFDCNIVKNTNENIINITSTDTQFVWYKGSKSLKGFKDYKINGVSAFNIFRSY